MLKVNGKTEEEIMAKSDAAIQAVEEIFAMSPLPEFPIITKAQIAAIPYGVRYELAEGIWGWRLMTEIDDKAEIIFCEFKALSRLRFHKHDCIEDIIRIDGDFKGMDDRMRYEAGEVHELIAKNQDGRIIVKFT